MAGDAFNHRIAGHAGLDGEAIMNIDRELTVDELAAVSGGLVVQDVRTIILGHSVGTTDGGAGPAISAWNNALESSGFPHMA